MLKGHTFNLQTFTSEAFALFIDKFLDGKSGVAKGCNLSNTNNSVTISDGYFVVRGRFLQVISGVTVPSITINGFYSLVCEIDLSKTNTTDQLNQAEIKVLYNSSNYPTLTQQDITGDGTIYQYEFAIFKVESGQITNFTDKRTYVNMRALQQQIEDELTALESQSNVLLKTGGVCNGDFTFNGEVNANITGDCSGSSSSCTGNSATATKLQTARNIKLQGAVNGNANFDGSGNITINTTQSNIAVLTGSTVVNASSSKTVTINYPSGYTESNCIPIAFALKSTAKGYNYFGAYKYSSDLMFNAFTRRLNLESSNISVYIENPTSDQDLTINYKIVLMKIS